jgi:hypothetical protein
VARTTGVGWPAGLCPAREVLHGAAQIKLTLITYCAKPVMGVGASPFAAGWFRPGPLLVMSSKEAIFYSDDTPLGMVTQAAPATPHQAVFDSAALWKEAGSVADRRGLPSSAALLSDDCERRTGRHYAWLPGYQLQNPREI